MTTLLSKQNLIHDLYSNVIETFYHVFARGIQVKIQAFIQGEEGAFITLKSLYMDFLKHLFGYLYVTNIHLM